ncbi:MAG: helix-turn-helix transcriptional regulator [Clostridia bacterium]|nr:helix-turn-helix transcriptional regulator [Clostridia bacterium]
MKLNIGYNIRTLRRAADMTQDELAVKLGVTFQTVSRWENGGSYPDIELLPVLADIFGVTTDHLLGNDVEVRREQLKDLTNRLDQAVKERRNDTVIELLREFRRDLRRYAEFAYELQYTWLTLKEYRMDAPPEVLEEVRQLWDELKSRFRTGISRSTRFLS